VIRGGSRVLVIEFRTSQQGSSTEPAEVEGCEPIRAPPRRPGCQGGKQPTATHDVSAGLSDGGNAVGRVGIENSYDNTTYQGRVSPHEFRCSFT